MTPRRDRRRRRRSLARSLARHGAILHGPPRRATAPDGCATPNLRLAEEAERARVPEPLGRPALAKDGRHPLESGWRFWYESSGSGEPHTPEGAGAAGSPTGVGKNGKAARPAVVQVAPFATLEDFWIQVTSRHGREVWCVLGTGALCHHVLCHAH